MGEKWWITFLLFENKKKLQEKQGVGGENELKIWKKEGQ